MTAPACPCDGECAARPRAAYYVSARREDGANALVCGPYPTHSEALADVAAARDACYRLSPETWWLAWGTCGSDDPVRARWDRPASISA